MIKPKLDNMIVEVRALEVYGPKIQELTETTTRHKETQQTIM